MEKRLIIGEVSKPQGIFGELKIKTYTDNDNRFKTLKNVYIGGVNYEVMRVRVSPEAVYLAVKGLADRNAAELLRGKLLEIDRVDAAPLKKGSYFIVDVLGSKVITDSGDIIGEVTDIQSGRQDIYTVKSENKIIMFPLLKDVLKSIDIESKTVTVYSKRFFEVAVYED